MSEKELRQQTEADFSVRATSDKRTKFTERFPENEKLNGTLYDLWDSSPPEARARLEGAGFDQYGLDSVMRDEAMWYLENKESLDEKQSLNYANMFSAYQRATKKRGFDPVERINSVDAKEELKAKKKKISEFGEDLKLSDKGFAEKYGFPYGDNPNGHRIAKRFQTMEILSEMTGRPRSEIAKNLDAYSTLVADNLMKGHFSLFENREEKEGLNQIGTWMINQVGDREIKEQAEEMFSQFNPEGYVNKPIAKLHEVIRTITQNEKSLSKVREVVRNKVMDDFVTEGYSFEGDVHRLIQDPNLTDSQKKLIKSEYAQLMKYAKDKYQHIYEAAAIAAEITQSKEYWEVDKEGNYQSKLVKIAGSLKTPEERQLFKLMLSKQLDKFGLKKGLAEGFVDSATQLSKSAMWMVNQTASYTDDPNKVRYDDLPFYDPAISKTVVNTDLDTNNIQPNRIKSLSPNDAQAAKEMETLINEAYAYKPESALDKVLLGSASFISSLSVGGMYGLTLSIGTQEHLRAKAAGASDENALAYGAGVGLMIGYTEHLQNKIAFGMMPTLKGFLVGRGSLAKFLTRSATNVGVSMGIETLQGYTQGYEEDVLMAVEKDGVDLGGLKNWRLYPQLKDNALFVLIPSLIGAAGRNASNFIDPAELKAMVSTKRGLRNVLKVQDAELIDKVMNTKGVDAKLDVLKESGVFGEDGLREIIKMRVDEETAMKNLLAAKEKGLPINFTETKGGKVVEFPTLDVSYPINNDKEAGIAYDAAMDLAKSKDGTVYRRAVVADTIKGLIGDAKFKEVFVDTDLNVEVEQWRIDAAIREGVLEKGATAEQLKVLATNEVFVDKEGVLRDVTRLLEDDNIETVLEDSAEGTVKYLVAKGLVETSELVDIVNSVDAKLIKGVDTTTEEGQKALVEAVSSIALAYTQSTTGRNQVDPAVALIADAQMATSAHIVRLASKIQDAKDAGSIKGDQVTLLEGLVGLSRDERIATREQAQSEKLIDEANESTNEATGKSTQALTTKQKFEAKIRQIESSPVEIKAKHAKFVMDKLNSLRGSKNELDMSANLKAIANLIPAKAMSKSEVNALLSKANFDNLPENQTSGQRARSVFSRISKVADKLERALDKYASNELKAQIIKDINRARPNVDSKTKNVSAKTDPDTAFIAESIGKLIEKSEIEQADYEAGVNQRAIDWANGGDEKAALERQSYNQTRIDLEQDVIANFMDFDEQTLDSLQRASDYMKKLVADGKDNLVNIKKAEKAEYDRITKEALADRGGRDDISPVELMNAKASKVRQDNLGSFTGRLKSFFEEAPSDFYRTLNKFFDLKRSSKVTEDVALRLARAGRLYDIEQNRRRHKHQEVLAQIDAANRGVKKGRFDYTFDKFNNTKKKFKTLEAKQLKDIRRSISFSDLINDYKNMPVDEQIAIIEALNGRTTKLGSGVVSLVDGLEGKLSPKLQAEFDAKASKPKAIGKVNYEYIGKRAAGKVYELNVFQAMTYIMQAEQNQYREAFDLNGIDENALAEMKDFVEKNGGLPYVEHIFGEFDSSWTRMNDAFKSVFHTDLPKVDRYVPTSFMNLEKEVSLIQQNGTSTASMRPSSTKRRVRRVTAIPEPTSIVEVFEQHFVEMDYWATHVKLFKDISNTLASKTILDDMAINEGYDAMLFFKKNMDSLMNEGVMSAFGFKEINKTANFLIKNRSILGMSWNLSTALINVDAGTRSMLGMSTKDYMKHLGEVTKNPAIIKEVFNSELIKTRLNSGFNPEMRELIEKRTKDGTIDKFIRTGFAPMVYTDAATTAYSSAIAWSFFKEKGQKAGLVGQELQNFIEDNVDLMIQRYSQPNRKTSLSVAERNAKGFMKIPFQFKSDLRLNLAVELEAWRVLGGSQKTYSKKRALKILAWSRILRPMMYWGLKGAYGMAFQDKEPEEAFDLSKLGLYMALGPAQGFAVMGEFFVALSLLFGEKAYDVTSTDITRSLKGIGTSGKDVFNYAEDMIFNEQGEEPEDIDMERTAKNLSKGLGYVLGGKAAGLYPAFRVLSEARTGWNDMAEDRPSIPTLFYSDKEKFDKIEKAEYAKPLEEIQEKIDEFNEKLKKQKDETKIEEIKAEKAKAAEERDKIKVESLNKILDTLQEDEKEAFLDHVNPPKKIRERLNYGRK